MAVKRMMNTNIIDTDEFLKMPMSARLLYYDFCMRADDDGMIDSPIKIMKAIGCTEDDLRVLCTKNYIIPFNSGILVITHWLIHNTIRRDRYNPTIHIDERNQLVVVDKTYKLSSVKSVGNQLATNWQPSIEKNSSNNSNINTLESSESKEMDSETFSKVFEIIEKEFGRTISPLETEMIKTWDYPLDILKLAIMEASTSGQFVIKYIDKIIYNWKKGNVRTLNDAKRYIEQFNIKKERKNNQLDRRDEISSTDCYEPLD